MFINSSLLCFLYYCTFYSQLWFVVVYTNLIEIYNIWCINPVIITPPPPSGKPIMGRNTLYRCPLLAISSLNDRQHSYSSKMKQSEYLHLSEDLQPDARNFKVWKDTFKQAWRFGRQQQQQPSNIFHTLN